MKKPVKVLIAVVISTLMLVSALTLSACKCECDHENKSCTCNHENANAKCEHEYENGKCIKCGAWVITEGVEYALTEDGNSYGVIGYKSRAAAEVYILPEYNGKPVTTIFREAFAESNIVSVNIPESVTTIEYGYSNADGECLGAFVNCERLQSVVMGNGVTSIGNYAFENCSSLTSITIPESVTSIGGFAFARCSSLTSITIPDSVTSIGDYAFYECTSLKEVNYKGTAEQWNKINIYGGNDYLKRSKRNYIK